MTSKKNSGMGLKREIGQLGFGAIALNGTIGAGIFALPAIAAGVDSETINSLPVLRHLRRMGEEIDNDDPEAFEALGKTLAVAFATLTGGSAEHAG